jgi:hypothetical protein
MVFRTGFATVTSGAFGCAFNVEELPNTSANTTGTVLSRRLAAIDRMCGRNAIYLFFSFGAV